ncbi:MAG: hypothetical protein HC909_03730, partial [Blastochloris sp.]|nr:hypothetical protein [Blastochloris sp.]
GGDPGRGVRLAFADPAHGRPTPQPARRWALVGLYDLLSLEDATGTTPVETRAVLVMAATGGVVGLIYWLIAGRNASGFLSPGPVSPPPAR